VALTRQVTPTPTISSSHGATRTRNHRTAIQIGRQNPQLNGLTFGSQIGLACRAMVSPTIAMACSSKDNVAFLRVPGAKIGRHGAGAGRIDNLGDWSGE